MRSARLSVVSSSFSPSAALARVISSTGMAVLALAATGQSLSAQAQGVSPDVVRSLVAVGCYEGAPEMAKPLAIRTAARCFQTGIGGDPDGTLSREEEERLHHMAAAGETVERAERYVARQIRGEDLRPAPAEARGGIAESPGAGVEGAQSEPPELLADLRDLIARSRDASDGSVTASRPYPEDRFDTPLIQISRDGVPVMVYAPRFYGQTGFDISLSFSCAPDEMVDITQMLFAGGQPDPLDPDADLSLQIAPFGGGKMTIPVTLVETLPDTRGLVRVHGRVSATDRFFTSMRPTTNLQVQLKVNRQFVPFNGGTDLTTLEADVRPVFETCAGITPTPAAQGQADPDRDDGSAGHETAGYWTPEESDILAAIRAAVTSQMTAIDAMAGQCDVVGETQNPFAAVACIATGFGSFNSRSMNWDIHSVSLDRCVRASDGDAFCRYTVDSTFSGSGLMGEMAGLFNTAMAIGGATYAQFNFVDGRWVLERTYESCDFGGGEINCQWTERR